LEYFGNANPQLKLRAIVCRLGEAETADGLKNPEGISSFSPALADAIGLRRVISQNGNQPGTG